MGSNNGNICFQARKRREVEPLDARPPSDRIARKKHAASSGPTPSTAVDTHPTIGYHSIKLCKKHAASPGVHDKPPPSFMNPTPSTAVEEPQAHELTHSNPYQNFVKVMATERITEPDLKGPGKMKRLGQLWEGLSEDEHKKWVQQRQQHDHRHHHQHAPHAVGYHQADGKRAEDVLSSTAPDETHTTRRVHEDGHAREGAGNTLLALRECSSSKKARVLWSVDATTFEFHTPELIRRQRSIGGKKGMLVLPPLEVRPSLIPHGGFGVFALKPIKKGTWLTEYGGEIIDVKEAHQRRQCGHDTHIRSCGFMERCIDARVRECWDVDYYVRHHMVGGFFNDAHGTGKKVNSEYVTMDCLSAGYQPPYKSAPWMSKRVFLRAACDISAGEELLVTYGSTYHALHFAPSSPPRCSNDEKLDISSQVVS